MLAAGTLSLHRIAVISFAIAAFVQSIRNVNADDLELKKRYYRLYMEYQNVEIWGTINETGNNGTLTHDFVSRYGSSRGGRVPPMEIFTLRPNPGEPHITDKLLMDEAFAISDSFLNVQFRREYISTHRYDKFFGIVRRDGNIRENDNERFSKALRLSSVYLSQNSTSPPRYFAAIQRAVQMGLDGFDPKVYWGNESKHENGTRFVVLGSEEFLGFPCQRVRYWDLQGIAIEALIATEPSLQVLKVLDVSDPNDVLPEDSKSIWLNLPKTESIKRFGPWLIRNKVSYSDPDWSWDVTIKDVKPLPEGYEGLWSKYNSLTGCYFTGPAEPQTRKGTTRVPVEESPGHMMVPYTDDEMGLITAYLQKELAQLDKPKPSLVRVGLICVVAIAAGLIVVVFVKRYKARR